MVSESPSHWGRFFNESIIRYICRKKRLVIGPLTAEKIKISVGTVDRRAMRTIEVRGGCKLWITMMAAVNFDSTPEAQVMNILKRINYSEKRHQNCGVLMITASFLPVAVLSSMVGRYYCSVVLHLQSLHDMLLLKGSPKPLMKCHNCVIPWMNTIKYCIDIL